MTSWDSTAESIKREREFKAAQEARQQEKDRQEHEEQHQRMLDFDAMVTDFVEAAATVGNPGARGLWKKQWTFPISGVVSLEKLTVYTSGDWWVHYEYYIGDSNRPIKQAVMSRTGDRLHKHDMADEHWSTRVSSVRRALAEHMLDHDIPLPPGEDTSKG